MTESELYQNHIKPFLNSKGAFFFRVEHPRIPDVYTAKNGKVLWIELKCANVGYSPMCIRRLEARSTSMDKRAQQTGRGFGSFMPMAAVLH